MRLRTLAVVALLLGIGSYAYLQLPQAAAPQSWVLPASPQPSLSHSFTLLNWNIQKRSYEPKWQQQFAAIEQQYQPELITLQEVSLTASKQNPSNSNAVYAPNLITHSGYSGLLTATPTPAVDHFVRLTTAAEPVSDTPKIALYSQHLLPHRQQLLLINIHAINFVTDAQYQNQLNDLHKQITSHNGPVVLSGDFNSWSDSRQRRLDNVVASLGLSEVYFADSGEIKSFFGHRLDHIYFSQHLSTVTGSAMVLDQFDASDHAPMIVSFSLATAE
ncbi:endonuclease/exonuclease/phosphatase family protein [Ferrimonas lipolytica]|nr:endonuclease/exonuclease/phosphatase family protein [Ferrimonas lipolytica]